MAFVGYFTQFRIAVLARFSAIFIIFLTGSLLFSVVFSIRGSGPWQGATCTYITLSL